MSHVKAGGSTKNLRDSQPKYLGIKLHDGEKAKIGNIIVRQRGTKIIPGKNTTIGKDHTIYSKIDGVVTFGEKRIKQFNGKTTRKKIVNVK